MRPTGRSRSRPSLIFASGGSPIADSLALGRMLREVAPFATAGTSVRCEVDLPSDLWPVWADEGQVGQVVNNLVINAVEAMPGGGTVRFGARNVLVAPDDGLLLHPGRYVEVTVADEGPGVPLNLRGRIFDPFFTSKEKGSGLGLAVCHSVVSRHGGHIEVGAGPGGGALFRSTS